jgi:hypothetical protein
MLPSLMLLGLLVSIVSILLHASSLHRLGCSPRAQLPVLLPYFFGWTKRWAASNIGMIRTCGQHGY